MAGGRRRPFVPGSTGISALRRSGDAPVGLHSHESLDGNYDPCRAATSAAAAAAATTPFRYRRYQSATAMCPRLVGLLTSAPRRSSRAEMAQGFFGGRKEEFLFSTYGK